MTPRGTLITLRNLGIRLVAADAEAEFEYESAADFYCYSCGVYLALSSASAEAQKKAREEHLAGPSHKSQILGKVGR